MSATPAEPTERKRGRRQVPEWERASIRKLMWVGVAAVFTGMIVGVFLERMIGSRSSVALWVPWLVGFIMIIPAAYQRGVRDARAHPEDSAIDETKAQPDGSS